ncbi:GHMP family kinase ATP-binding protein [Streptomyces sp. NPDC005047]|uniref:GHMP family kinase ATP-binding protein n=1 Tax=unclassified Streptomyces TaxID=2593676 RepID=UPI00363B1D76
MWISSAPLRISLAGGGTDVPGYARRFGGLVLGATTDLRVTVVGRPAGTHRHIRACLDECSSTAGAGITNPFAREALSRHWDGSPLDLASFADVPGGSGLGSSSAFSVALVAGLEGGALTQDQAAEAASSIEMHGLGRPVGRQDQYLSAHGGFRTIDFHRDGTVAVEEVPVDEEFVHRLDEELLLFFTGRTRDAGEVLGEQNARVAHSDRDAERRLHAIKALTPLALDALKNNDATALGQVLGAHWELKRHLGSRVSLPSVERAYADALDAGASGGKLLGAGGGGYFLVHSRAACRDEVRTAMATHGFTEQPFRFDTRGVRVTSVDPAGQPTRLPTRPPL